MWRVALTCVALICGTLVLAQQQPDVTLRVIVVASEAEAQQVVTRLQQGADFAALASEVSQDPSSATGGLLGRVNPATLRQELRDALRGVGPGQLSPIVRIPTGFAVLTVVPGGSASAPPVTNAPPGRSRFPVTTFSA